MIGIIGGSGVYEITNKADSCTKKMVKTDYGDVVLYSGDQIVVFYGSNSWAYTRLGHIDLSQEEMSDLLGNGDVTITLTED